MLLVEISKFQKKLYITDYDNLVEGDDVLFWNNPAKNKLSKKFHIFLNKNKESIRQDYLKFIHNLLIKIKKKQKKSDIKDYVDFSLLAEKNVFKSDNIYDVLKVLSLIKFFKHYNLREVVLDIRKDELRKVLKSYFLFKKTKINNVLKIKKKIINLKYFKSFILGIIFIVKLFFNSFFNNHSLKNINKITQKKIFTKFIFIILLEIIILRHYMMQKNIYLKFLKKKLFIFL